MEFKKGFFGCLLGLDGWFWAFLLYLTHISGQGWKEDGGACVVSEAVSFLLKTSEHDLGWVNGGVRETQKMVKLNFIGWSEGHSNEAGGTMTYMVLTGDLGKHFNYILI